MNVVFEVQPSTSDSASDTDSECELIDRRPTCAPRVASCAALPSPVQPDGVEKHCSRLIESQARVAAVHEGRDLAQGIGPVHRRRRGQNKQHKAKQKYTLTPVLCEDGSVPLLQFIWKGVDARRIVVGAPSRCASKVVQHVASKGNQTHITFNLLMGAIHQMALERRRAHRVPDEWPAILFVDGHTSRNASLMSKETRPALSAKRAEREVLIANARKRAIDELSVTRPDAPLSVFFDAAHQAEEACVAGLPELGPEDAIPPLPDLTESAAWEAYNILLIISNPRRSHTSNPGDQFVNAAVKEYVHTKGHERRILFALYCRSGDIPEGSVLNESARHMRRLALWWACEYFYPLPQHTLSASVGSLEPGKPPHRIVIASFMKALVPHGPCRLPHQEVPVSEYGYAAYYRPSLKRLVAELGVITAAEQAKKLAKLDVAAKKKRGAGKKRARKRARSDASSEASSVSSTSATAVSAGATRKPRRRARRASTSTSSASSSA